MEPGDATRREFETIDEVREFTNDAAFDGGLAEFERWREVWLVDGVASGNLHCAVCPVRERSPALSEHDLLKQDAKGLFGEQTRIEEERTFDTESASRDVHALDLEIREQVEEPRRVESQHVIEQKFRDVVGRCRSLGWKAADSL